MNTRQRSVSARRFLAAALVSFGVAFPAIADDVTLTVDNVQQRYPWNGYVDIDYTITCANGAALGPDDNLEVLMIDKSVSPAVTNRAIRFLQVPLPMTEGRHRITWDARGDGVNIRTDKAEFRVEIARYAKAYMIIDVSGGSSASVFPTTFVNRPPADGFTASEYKTSKIVLRRIHPGSYMAGSPTGEYGRTSTREAQHPVVLTKPFYIGLYQLTQAQYQNVMGANPVATTRSDGKWSADDIGPARPVAYVSYNTLRGSTANWPTVKSVAAGSFMHTLLQKCKSKDPVTGAYTVTVTGFDLPTEFQWEYACRAGTTGAYNTTNAYDNTQAGHEAALKDLAQFTPAGESARRYVDVGSFASNGWGLYDMHGNAWEWTRDWMVENVTSLGLVVDPEGPSAGTGATVNQRVRRSGTCGVSSDNCRSAQRSSSEPSKEAYDIGFRLARDLP